MSELHEGCALAEITARAIRRYPDRIAIMFGDDEITYRQLGEKISQYAQALKSLGLRRGDAAAQLSSNRPEALFVTCACQLLGIRLTPLAPKGSEDDHAFILQDAEISALVVDMQRFGARAEALMTRVPGLRHVLTYESGKAVNLCELASTFPPVEMAIEAKPDDICLINYTGGTTGRPKGVVHTSRVRVELIKIALMEFDWPEEIRFLACTPITHAAGAMFLPTLAKGGTFVVLDEFSADTFLGAIERYRATMALIVPTMLYVMLDSKALTRYDTSSLQVMLYGSAPMSTARLKAGIEHFGPVFMQFYGQTEAPIAATILPRAEHDLNRPERLASCGRPVTGMQVCLMDEEGRPVPTGATGEICVRGPLVMEGYWKRPEETSAALRHGWLHTGDVAKADAEGFLYILDRTKDMIITGGFNVYPREVEDVLMQHPAISSAAVIGVPDPKWGEAVKAVVVLKSGCGMQPAEAANWVKEKKGSIYSPKSIEFVDEIPLTNYGKPDKKALRARYVSTATHQES